MAVQVSDTLVLSIQLPNDRSVYNPGHTLKGTVQLRLAKDTSIGKITITFSGRTKSKISRSNGQSQSIFRGRAKLFTFQQILNDDHFTRKAGLLEWPFEFRMPDMIDASVVKGDKWKAKDGFLASDDDNQLHPLPPSFQFTEYKTGRAWNGHATYMLEVNIIEPVKGELTLPTKARRCVKSIHVLPEPLADVIDLQDPRFRSGLVANYTVKSLRLLPSNIHNLSIVEKTVAFFNTTSLPRLTFELDVSYATKLQVAHPEPIPFIVAVNPKTDPDLTTIQPTAETFFRYPSVSIRRFTLLLDIITQCRCPAFIADEYMSTINSIVLAEQRPTDTRLLMRSMASDQKTERRESGPMSVDLGKQYNIYMPDYATIQDSSKSSKSKAKTSIYNAPGMYISPSFETYNISRKYRLAWTFELECAAEKLTCKGHSDEYITVLGPPVSSVSRFGVPDQSWVLAQGSNCPDSDDDGENQHASRVARRSSTREDLPAYTDLPPGYSSLNSAAGQASSEKHR